MSRRECRGKKREIYHECGKFVCEACIKVHRSWREYSTHKVINLEQLKSDVTLINELPAK